MYRLEPTILGAVIKLQKMVFTAPFYRSAFKYYCWKCLIISLLIYNLVPELNFFITNLHNIRVCTSAMPTLCQLLTTIFKVLYLSFRINSHFNLLQVYELTIRKRRSFSFARCYTITEMQITKLTKWFTISIFLYIAVYIVPPLTYQIYKFFVDSEPETHYMLPFKHVYFFTISTIPQYILIVTFGIISTVIMGISYLSIDLAFFSYCLYTRALFRDLQTMFDFDLTKDSLVQLKEAIQFHFEIFRSIDKLNALFSPIIFAQFLDSSLLICTIIFQSTLDVPMSPEKIKNIFFVFGAICQILFYSIFGTIITEESFKISNIVYFSKWTDAQFLNNKTFRKLILIIIHRSQNEVTLNGLKVFKCNLETFLSIMDISFSTLAVLQSVST